MSTEKTAQLGKLPPKYSFVLNPYPDERLSSCPFCGQRTGQRKLPLLIHVDPMHPIALNYTCRYCHNCDLLIAHKHEIEHLLTEIFKHYDPNVIGNEYLIFGTAEKRAWREGLTHPKAIDDMLQHTSDFAIYYQELRMRQTGWYREGEEPSIKKPPPSQEWIKSSVDPVETRAKRGSREKLLAVLEKASDIEPEEYDKL